MMPTNPRPGLEQDCLQELLKYYESLLKHISVNQPPNNSTEATSGSLPEGQEGQDGEEGDVSTGEGVDERAADVEVGEDDGDRAEGDEEDMEPDYQPPAKKTKYYQKRVLISDLPEETQRQQREAWREASRRRRARKMSSLQTNPTQPCHPPQNTDTWGD